MIQFISTKNVSSYSEYQETHGFVLTMSLPWRHVPTCMLSWTPTKVYDRGKNSGWVWLKIKALLLEMRQANFQLLQIFVPFKTEQGR